MTTDPIAIRALIVAPFHETETTWDVGDLSEAKDAAWKRNRLNDRNCDWFPLPASAHAALEQHVWLN